MNHLTDMGNGSTVEQSKMGNLQTVTAVPQYLDRNR